MPIVLSAGTTLVSTDASALVSHLLCMQAWLAPHVSNTGLVLVGGSANQTLPLVSGTYLRFPVSNLNQVYAKTSAGSALISWVAQVGH
jgi:hypothetical protein